MIDNIHLIKNLLNFTEEGDFYMLYVFKRKKDQPEGEIDKHQSVRTIKTYCIESIEHLESRYDEIKQLCEMFKARAYIHVQRQNHRDVSYHMIQEIAKRLQNGNFNQKNVFDSVVGKVKTQEKFWVVDIDTKDFDFLKSVRSFINQKCLPLEKLQLRVEGEYKPVTKMKTIECIPTNSGYHLITERFDSKTFKESFPVVDIQKKNPTLLYFPVSLEK